MSQVLSIPSQHAMRKIHKLSLYSKVENSYLSLLMLRFCDSRILIINSPKVEL